MGFPTALAGPGIVLLLAVIAGTAAHELAHMLVLRLSGVTYDVEWLPERTGDRTFGAGLSGRLVAVTPTSIPVGTSPSAIRVASMAPFALAIPLFLVAVGVLPDPLATDSVYPTAATVGWLACSIPSPHDFSVFWHAHRALDGGSRSDAIGQGT